MYFTLQGNQFYKILEIGVLGVDIYYNFLYDLDSGGKLIGQKTENTKRQTPRPLRYWGQAPGL